MIVNLALVVDEHKNYYHPSIGKEPVDADYHALTEGIETNPEPLKFKVGDRVKITKDKNIFSTCCTKNWLKELFVIDSVMKTNPDSNIKNNKPL